MNIYFVRHGKDDENYRGGWSQIPLIEEGVMQVNALGEMLKAANLNCVQIISSDLLRAKQSANILGHQLGVKVTFDSALREINNGALANLTNMECEQKYPGLYFNSLRMDEAYPLGESPQIFYKRISDWFDDVLKNEKPESQIIVTHGGVIRIIYHLVNQEKWTNQTTKYPVANASVHHLSLVDGKLKFEEITV